MKRLFCLLFSVACLLSAAFAAEPIILDQDLRYLRVTSSAQSSADLRAALLKPAPIVVDLRYTADEPHAEEILLEFRTAPRKPTIYVLVSPATPRSFADELTKSHLTVLGVKGSRPEPTVVVAQSAEDDRRAYDAFTSGTPLANLISGKVEKERFDEASLVTEFKAGNHDAHPPESDGKPAGPAKLVDRVLQRAAHLNRAAAALKPRG